MKYLLIPIFALLMGCTYITVDSGGGDVNNLAVTKQVPITTGKDIQDTGKTSREPVIFVEPMAPEAIPIRSMALDY